MNEEDHCANYKGDIDDTIEKENELLSRWRNKIVNEKRTLIASSATRSDQSQSKSQNTFILLDQCSAALEKAEKQSQLLGRYLMNNFDESHQNGKNFSNVSPRDTRYTKSVLGSLASQKCMDGDTRGSFSPELRNVETIASDENLDRSNTNSSTTGTWNDSLSKSNRSTDLDNYRLECDFFSSNMESHGTEILFRESKASTRLYELIAALRTQRENITLKNQEENYFTATKKILRFDPSKMEVSKRAALREAKLGNNVTVAEEKSQKMSSFKALPLPGGIHVKNNIFATTKAFKGKRVDMSRKILRQVSKHQKIKGLPTSILNDCQCNDDSFFTTSRKGATKIPRKLHRKKEARKKNLLDETNTMIVKQSSNLPKDESIFVVRRCEKYIDESQLRQQITTLETTLRWKKAQCSAILNNIVDIDLDVIYKYLLFEGDSGYDEEQIQRLKKIANGETNDGIQCEKYEHGSNGDQSNGAGELNTATRQQNNTSKDSLFRRHRDWLKRRDKKITDARSLKEKEIMSTITGQPQVYNARKSWVKAKEFHREMLKKATNEEEGKLKETEENAKMEESGQKMMEGPWKETADNRKNIKINVTKVSQPHPNSYPDEKIIKKLRLHCISTIEEINVFSHFTPSEENKKIKYSGIEQLKDTICCNGTKEKTRKRIPVKAAIETTGGKEPEVAPRETFNDLSPTPKKVPEECVENEEPYMQYEHGEVSFFDSETSSHEIGRFRVRRTRGFNPETIHKKGYKAESGEDGITLLVGKKSTREEDNELVITIIFNLSNFNELSASQWWKNNRDSFV